MLTREEKDPLSGVSFPRPTSELAVGCAALAARICDRYPQLVDGLPQYSFAGSFGENLIGAADCLVEAIYDSNGLRLGDRLSPTAAPETFMRRIGDVDILATPFNGQGSIGKSDLINYWRNIQQDTPTLDLSDSVQRLLGREDLHTDSLTPFGEDRLVVAHLGGREVLVQHPARLMAARIHGLFKNGRIGGEKNIAGLEKFLPTAIELVGRDTLINCAVDRLRDFDRVEQQRMRHWRLPVIDSPIVETWNEFKTYDFYETLSDDVRAILTEVMAHEYPVYSPDVLIDVVTLYDRRTKTWVFDR